MLVDDQNQQNLVDVDYNSPYMFVSKTHTDKKRNTNLL
jgi:hypothetical protein